MLKPEAAVAKRISKRGQEHQQKQSFKTYYTSPFNFRWPSLKEEDQQTVLQTLARHFPEAAARRERTALLGPAVAVGLQAVTRAMQQHPNERLLFVVYVKRANLPTILCNHILVLSATRQIPLLVLATEDAASLLGAAVLGQCGAAHAASTTGPQVSAVAVRKSESFSEEVPWIREIQNRQCAVNLPWLDAPSGQPCFLPAAFRQRSYTAPVGLSKEEQHQRQLLRRQQKLESRKAPGTVSLLFAQKPAASP